MCGSRFGIGYVGMSRGMTPPRRPSIDAGIGVKGHDRRVAGAHEQPSAMSGSGCTVGILNDSLLEKRRIRRRVGTPAVHGADQVAGEIRATR